MEEISTEFENKADELRSLSFLEDTEKAAIALQQFIQEADPEEFTGVCYYVGLGIISVMAMAPEIGFIEFQIASSEDTTTPMAFYLNTFLNSLVWQNPQLAVATSYSISQHTKKTRSFFLWKLLLISQSLSDMLVDDLTSEEL